MTETENMKNLEANLSLLVMSIASSAAMGLGLAPNPQTGKIEKNKELAKFNIDLLLVIREKTKNNLTNDENKLLESIISDLQIKFIEK